MTLQGRVLGQRYRLEQPLGAGGMGHVWLGTDTRLDREVAIKLLGPEFNQPNAQRRFMREAQLAASLNSVHIARVFDFGVHPAGEPDDDERLYLVMERLEGRDLEARTADGPIDLELADTIAHAVCDALAEAHRLGIVHRDIKPANLFLAFAGAKRVVKVLDFGIATRTASTSRLTAKGMIIGTPAYMSPEQSQGDAVDARSDLWSLAVVLYEALTGRHPFESKTDWETLAAISNRPIAPPSETAPQLPASMDEFFRIALRRAPDKRFPTADAFAAAFEAAAAGRMPREPEDFAAASLGPTTNLTPGPPGVGLASETTSATTDTVAIRSDIAPPPPRRRWPLAVAGLAFAVLVVSVVMTEIRPAATTADLEASPTPAVRAERDPAPASLPVLAATTAAPVTSASAAPSPLPAKRKRRRQPRPAAAPARRSPSPPPKTAPQASPNPDNEFGI